uniref:Uncharacterized protein n=1 Tax=viral metagenome TaxID=1070528 RepID=A0A6M3LVZ8_9ZZZZ
MTITQTIRRVKPVIEDHFTIGLRRCDHLNQKKIETMVSKHDETLRRKYLTETKK